MLKREIKIKNYNISAKACVVKKQKTKTARDEDYDIETSLVSAVDLKGSKALMMATGDFGMVVYNELDFGFVVSWNEYERLQKELNVVSDRDYEELLDGFSNAFGDSILEFIASL